MEDDAGDMVVCHFNFADGNGENLIFIKKNEKPLSFGDNCIAEVIEKYHVKLLILVPMSFYIGEGCSMNNVNETRTEFNYLIAGAKDTGCATVINTHINKMKGTNPLYRTNGSIDIAGVARSILAITRTSNKETLTERYMMQMKSNSAPIDSAVLLEIAEKDVDCISKTDIVYMARALLADSFLSREVIANKNEDIVRYFTCMVERAATRCCMVNPLIGREIEGYEIAKAAVPKKIVVLGGSLAGCEASIHLAHEGKKVTVVEM